ncbi:hypothetical protein PMAYCL1PPCAC_19849 [Pristionchus mayeri]|uniref:Uncharacterized protein n=1 Tax=Pristionchus mayeri TaxID=1317129 RepID=A0AAN5CS98_9BILA|nr:hypothetical protein PMAYCL1PPCAC_19849 [Pristionchus mayeri]
MHQRRHDAMVLIRPSAIQRYILSLTVGELDDSIFESLRYCMGKHIYKVTIDFDEERLTELHKLFDGVNIDKLNLNMDEIFMPEHGSFVLKIASQSNIYQLNLSVSEAILRKPGGGLNHIGAMSIRHVSREEEPFF